MPSRAGQYLVKHCFPAICLSVVPSQTFTNRSFWTAASASGIVVNQPVSNWLAGNTAETIFNRLEQHGRTWKVYVGEPTGSGWVLTGRAAT
jgi:phospholipase C